MARPSRELVESREVKVTDGRVEYCHVYFNSSAISEKDINGETEVICERGGRENPAESFTNYGVAACMECAE